MKLSLLLACIWTAASLGAQDLTTVTAPPEAEVERLQLDPFYRRYVSAGGLPIVAGHRSLLETAVQNLITNAVKFVPDDRDPHIVIGVESDATAHHLLIRDNGIGIEPSHHERIFSIFERLHPREAYPGTGIGLAIVKKAARLHGGDALRALQQPVRASGGDRRE